MAEEDEGSSGGRSGADDFCAGSGVFEGEFCCRRLVFRLQWRVWKAVTVVRAITACLCGREFSRGRVLEA